jgi:hypothetical protein
MSSLFESDTPVPQQDPEAARLREEERRRAEEARTRATQEQLSTETRIRQRRTGRGLLGNVLGQATNYLGSG